MPELEDLNSIRAQLQSELAADRWAGAAALGEYVFDRPDQIWPLVLRFGSSAVEDVREAIATCVLEHILEHHFDKYFPMVEAEISRGNANLADTLTLCWRLGQAQDPARAEQWQRLLEALDR